MADTLKGRRKRGGKFIAGAVKHPGAFTASAKAAGEGVQEYAMEHEHDPGMMGKRARFAMTMKKIANRRKGGR